MNTSECSRYQYKRINHFTEMIDHYQSHATCQLPEDLYIEIKAAIKEKETESSSFKLTPATLKSILKELGHYKYYENIQTIIYKLTGTIPPPISDETREQLISMFEQIQIPFQKHQPPNRMSFLSYHQVLYKFFELLGLKNPKLREHLPYIHCLKSAEKSYYFDQIWKKICLDLGWEYIVTPDPFGPDQSSLLD